MLALIASSTGCLEPFDEGELGVDQVFGPPDIPPDEVPRVDADGQDLEEFTTLIEYLEGWVDSSTVGFWRVNGKLNTSVAPVWRLEREGELFGLPIVDAIPTDQGYTPFWRLHRVPVTEAYNDERIWSRDAVEAGIRLGILAPAVVTETVLVAPIVIQSLTYETVTGDKSPTDVWYRNQRASWVRFPRALNLSDEVREIQPSLSYTLQRISQPFVLDEWLESIDFDQDGLLRSTHRVFERSGTPLCRDVIARADDSLLSIDSGSLPQLISTEDPSFQGTGSFPVLGLRETSTVTLCPKELLP